MCKGGWEERYKALIKENKLLFTTDLIKEKLKDSYDERIQAEEMAKELKEIMNICEASKDKNLMRFSKHINEQFNSMVLRAKLRINNGMKEGINKKIKTLTRKEYCNPEN